MKNVLQSCYKDWNSCNCKQEGIIVFLVFLFWTCHVFETKLRFLFQKSKFCDFIIRIIYYLDFSR